MKININKNAGGSAESDSPRLNREEEKIFRKIVVYRQELMACTSEKVI